MDAHELQKLMDCCRPDGEDLAAPELLELERALAQDAKARERWEAVRQWDRAVGAAARDVVPPIGLEARLLAALDAQGPEQQAVVDRPRSGSADPVHPPGSRWTAAVMSLCALAATVAIVLWFAPWRDTLTEAESGRLARLWLASLDQQAWQAEPPPLGEYPLDPALRFLAVRWQRFAALGDAQAVAYQAELAPDRSTAYLLVVRTRQGTSLSSVPPPVPQMTTGGICVGVWKTQGLLYVLLVPGDPSQFQRAVDSQSFAAAGIRATWQALAIRRFGRAALSVLAVRILPG